MKITTIILSIILLSSAILPVLSQDAFADQLITDEYLTDIHFNPITKDITIEWNFGDNPHREKCVSITATVLNDNYIPGNKNIVWYSLGTNLNFLTNFVPNFNSGDSRMEISCKGMIVFNPNDFNKLLVIPSGVSIANLFEGNQYTLNMHFAEIIKLEYLHLYSDTLSRENENILSFAHFFSDVNGITPPLDCFSTSQPMPGQPANITLFAIDSLGSEKVFTVNGMCFDSLLLPTSSTHNTHNSDDDKKDKDGLCYGCIPTTIGYDLFNKIQVEKGFSFNGHAVDVINYHTDYPLISTEIGTTNTMKLKVYENLGLNSIKKVQVGLGVKEVGTPLNNAEVIIDLGIYAGEIESMTIKDKDNLLDNIIATYDLVQCTEAGTTDCLEITLKYSYRESPLYNTVMVVTSNIVGAAGSFYFNDGIDVTGESLNEQPTITKFNKLTSQQKDNLWITYTRTDKITNTWIDQNGIEYLKVNDNFERITPLPDYVCDDTPIEEVKVWKRIYCNFAEYKEEQAQRALEYLK